MTEKKDLFYIVILILTFIVMIVGATFSIYYFLHRQEEGSSSVYTGTLSIEYLSGTIITGNSIIPTNEPNFDETNNIYKNKFKVTNTGTLDSLLTINAVLNKNEFSDETLMYKLFSSEGTELEKGSISGTGVKSIATNISLPSMASSEFTLIIWLKETGENQNEEMKKTLSGLLKVDANQKKD